MTSYGRGSRWEGAAGLLAPITTGELNGRSAVAYLHCACFAALFAAPDQLGSAEHVRRAHTALIGAEVICASHSIPHEDCPNCLATVAAMRPTVFAELAAAEMRSGTESCRGCDYVYREVVAKCPMCALVHPFFFAARHDAAQTSELGEFWGQPVATLLELTLRDLKAAIR